MTGPAHIPCRVLVVDDDPGICTLLEVVISLDPRFELVAIAQSAGDTRLIVASQPGPVDAVLLDVTLPDCDGVDLLEELQLSLPDAQLALYTGWSDDPATRERAAAAGADALFRKDMAPALLLDELMLLCERVADRAT